MAVNTVKTMTDLSSNLTYNTPTLHTLPDDLLWYILSQLPARDILSCVQTCRTIRDVGRDEFLWKGLAQRNLPATLLSSKSNSETWYEFGKLYLGTRVCHQLQNVSEKFHRIFNKENPKEIRIAVLGNRRAGKSTLTIRFTAGMFVRDHDPITDIRHWKQLEVRQSCGWILIAAD